MLGNREGKLIFLLGVVGLSWRGFLEEFFGGGVLGDVGEEWRETTPTRR